MQSAENRLITAIRNWIPKSPAATDLQVTCRRQEIEMYFLGGVCRSCWDGKPPRDIDVVISDQHWHRFLDHIPKDHAYNRFGGVKFKIYGTTVDAWPMSRTWTFSAGHSMPCSPTKLPETVLLNIQAVAVLVWHPQEPWMFEKRFFEAMRTRTLEIENPETPHPELAVAVIEKFMAEGWHAGSTVEHFLQVTQVDRAKVEAIKREHT